MAGKKSPKCTELIQNLEYQDEAGEGVEMAGYINDNLRSAIEVAQPFRDALAVLNRTSYYAERINHPLVDRFSEVESALTRGIFDRDLASSLEGLYQPYQEQRMIMETLGNGLVRPNYYEGVPAALLAVSDRLAILDHSQAIRNMTAGFTACSAGVSPVVNTSWIHDENVWGVAKSALSAIDLAGLGGGAFATLLRLEQEVSSLPGIETITSVTSQITSIQSALGVQGVPWLSMSRLLSDFAGFATKQHLAIRKMADNEAEVTWRLEALEAASKLVDRQVRWSEAIMDAIPSEKTDKGTEGSEDFPSVITMLPQHIAYSKRKNIDATPIEALESSKLVEITEKGKTISEKIVLINKMCEDCGKEKLFKYTDKVVSGMINMSTVVCSTEMQLGGLIDGLYFVFYENLEHIKTFIGGGDQQIGNQKVREEAVYQCIFNVKTIRSDLRHDLDHGTDGEIRKKLMSVGDCYKHYCKRRPTMAKDYKLLQLRLYDEFLLLMDSLVGMFD